MKTTTRPGSFDPTTDLEGPSVCITTLVPQRLAELVRDEATRLMVSRSQIVRWALAERYMPSASASGHD